MKRFIGILFLLLSSISVAQKFSYFPLTVGNKWFFSEGIDNVVRLQLEIEKDTKCCFAVQILN